MISARTRAGLVALAALACAASCEMRFATAPVSAPSPTVAPPLPAVYEELAGPFPSWANARSFGALGDGRADDTTALQRSLDAIGEPIGGVPAADCEVPGPAICKKAKTGHATNIVATASTPSVLYLPAGTYRITRTLLMYDRAFVSVVGEDPLTTKIVWDGDAGSDMLLVDGVTHSTWRRVGWDGRKKARAAVFHGFSRAHGGVGGEIMEHADESFQDLSYGIMAGGPSGANDADASVRRCRFRNISEAGLVTQHFNALNWHVWESTFEDCAHGLVNRAGSWHAHNDLFLRSTAADLKVQNCQFFGVRGNTSIGSNRFLEDGFFRVANPYLIQANTIVHPVQDDAIQVNKVGDTVLLDNHFLVAGERSRPLIAYGEAFRFLLDMMGPQAGSQRARTTPGDVVIAGNVVLRGDAIASAVPATTTARLVAIEEPMTRVTIPLEPPAMPGVPPRIAGRAVFEVPQKATAREIQSLVGQADRLFRGRRPILHFPPGAWSIDETIAIPAGLDLQITGDSLRSSLEWTGTASAPLMRLAGPARASMRDLSLRCPKRCESALTIETEDAPGGRIYGDLLLIASTTSEALHFDGLDETAGRFENGNLSSIHVTGGGSERSRGVDVFGAGLSGQLAAGVDKFVVDGRGRLDLEDVWIEDSPPFTLHGSGDFTLQSAMYAAHTPLEHTGDPARDLEIATSGVSRVAGFEGTARFINVMTNVPIVFEGPAKVKGLLLGAHHISNPNDRARVAMEGDRRKLESAQDPFGEEEPDCTPFFANRGAGEVMILSARTHFAGALSVECKEPRGHDPRLLAELLAPLRAVDHRPIVERIADERITDVMLHDVAMSGDASRALLHVKKR